MQRLNHLARSLSGGLIRNDTHEDTLPPTENKTIFQAFEWYLPGPEDGTDTTPSHYTLLTSLLPHLAALGITHLWLPPGCKATSVHDNGYGIYDLYDLGEFDAKRNGQPARTKWGSKDELQVFCQVAKEHGINVLWDAVLNHKASADDKEVSRAVKVDPKDRNKTTTRPFEMESWTVFTFPARGSKYSDMKWNWKHFTAVDYDARRKEQGVFKFIGPGKKGEWATDVSEELGNYDYLMFADIDHSHPDVRSDLMNWATWISSSLQLGGMRLDAIKHYSLSFLHDLLRHLDTTTSRQGKDSMFFVGEYWDSKSENLQKIIEQFRGRLNLFDVQLVHNFSDISKGRNLDLRTVLDGSLVERIPGNAVTFVQNHDTQEMQSLASPVEEWFIPLAYAVILLRQGGTPCVFWGDVFGIHGPRPRLPACGGKLTRLVVARKLYAYGQQRDYLDAEDCIGWTRSGHKSKSNGAVLAVLLTNSWDRKFKRMFVGQSHAGETWKDILGWESDVVIDRTGFGKFGVGHRSMGVWTHEKAPDFERLSQFTFPRQGRGVPTLSIQSSLCPPI